MLTLTNPSPKSVSVPTRWVGISIRHSRVICVLLFACISCLSMIQTSSANTDVQSARARHIAFLIWNSEFAAAIDSCQALIRLEPVNPIGYCLLGITYHSIGSQFRTDQYSDSAMSNLDAAIVLADSLKLTADGYPNCLFVLGSAYGYRALEQSSRGHWWAAFRDGHHSCKLLEKAYRQDTSLADALLGVGDYHYWKSAKSKIVTWLPFVKDRRQLGISEILQVTRSGNGAELNAVKSLIPIYLNERQYSHVISLVDSLAWTGYTDPSCLLQKTRAEIKLSQWDIAACTLEELHRTWENSPYFDSCGACEMDYLKACILAGQGDGQAAQRYLEDILSRRGICESNVYYRETAANANKLLR